VQAEKQAKQEHDKLVARERQYAMANQISRITSAEFRDDVLQQMLEMDVSLIETPFDCRFHVTRVVH
jgi:thioredoxin-like negative regulator of GroEL